MNRFKEKSKESYDKKADNYDNTFDGKFTVKFKTKLLSNMIVSDGDKVLDIACGNGTFLKQLIDKFDIEGYGTDISDKMIDNAKRLNSTMHFAVADCENIPFENNFFDIITVCASFHHFPNVTAFAHEAFRLLKPNGKIYIAEVYYPAIIRIICNPFVPLSKAGDVKFYSPNEIIKTFEGVRFRQIFVEKSGHIQIICLLKK